MLCSWNTTVFCAQCFLVASTGAFLLLVRCVPIVSKLHNHFYLPQTVYQLCRLHLKATNALTMCGSVPVCLASDLSQKSPETWFFFWYIPHMSPIHWSLFFINDRKSAKHFFLLRLDKFHFPYHVNSFKPGQICVESHLFIDFVCYHTNSLQ